MAWNLDHGSAYRAALKAGRKITGNLVPPRVMPGAQSILNAFWELSTERQIGFGVGPVPGSKIDRAARELGILDPDRRADFRAIIRACDQVYLERSTPKDPNDKSAAAAKPAMAMGDFTAMLKRGAREK